MSMLNVQIYTKKIRHLLSGVIFRFLPNLRRLNVLFFYIYRYMYIYIYIYLYIYIYNIFIGYIYIYKVLRYML